MREALASFASYERRVLVAILAVGAPLLAASLYLVWSGNWATSTAIIATLVLCWLWISLSIHARAMAVRPLQTLSNMLAAIRQQDFAFRAPSGNTQDALGLAFEEANGLARSLSEQRVRTEEFDALLRTVISELDVAVFAFDAAERLKLANRLGERLLGATSDELLGRDASSLGVGEMLRDGNASTARFAGASGDSQWQVRRASFHLDGQPHTLLLLADVSASLRAGERQAWQRIIRVMTHEINNSLTPIITVAGSLKHRLKTASAAGKGGEHSSDAASVRAIEQGVSMISDRAESLSRFIDGYARLAKLPTPVPRPLRLSDLVRRVGMLERRIPVSIDVDDNVEVEADAAQIEQLVINLVTNAVDAVVEQERGEVTVRCFLSDSVATVDVIDDGPGVPDAARAFVPFFTTKEQGSGIGLALSRQIAEAHGGSLKLLSRVGNAGTVARLQLPARASHARVPGAGSGDKL